MQPFSVAPLAGSQARLTFPLVRESLPGVALEAWLRFASRMISQQAGRNGIMVATRAGQRFPSGLFCYRCHQDLTLGPVVTADYFVAIDILDPAPVVDAMVRELEQLGARLGCRAVRSVVHRRANVLTDRLRSGGHRMEATNFVKQIDGDATARH